MYIDKSTKHVMASGHDRSSLEEAITRAVQGAVRSLLTDEGDGPSNQNSFGMSASLASTQTNSTSSMSRSHTTFNQVCMNRELFLLDTGISACILQPKECFIFYEYLSSISFCST